MGSKFFWVDAFERAIRTVAQALLASMTVNGFTLMSANWAEIGSIALLAGVLSLLMSIIGSGSGNSASFVVDAKSKSMKG